MPNAVYNNIIIVMQHHRKALLHSTSQQRSSYVTKKRKVKLVISISCLYLHENVFNLLQKNGFQNSTFRFSCFIPCLLPFLWLIAFFFCPAFLWPIFSYYLLDLFCSLISSYPLFCLLKTFLISIFLFTLDFLSIFVCLNISCCSGLFVSFFPLLTLPLCNLCQFTIFVILW